MQFSEISSPQNRLYKQAVKQQRPGQARRDGVFAVEGIRAVEELSKASGWETVSLWADKEFFRQRPLYRTVYERSFPQAQGNVVPHDLFLRLSGTENPQGILAVVRRRSFRLEEVLRPGERYLLVVLENVQDPGNIGTILRTSDAAGAQALVLTRNCCDIYSPKVVRSSMGSLLHLPVLVMEDVSAAAQALGAYQIALYAASLEKSRTPWETDFTGNSAILIGNEGAGLSEQALSCARARVRIPMPGQAESLNAAIACGILLYEAVRQRNQKEALQEPRNV